jgi:hypothetical protein
MAVQAERNQIVPIITPGWFYVVKLHVSFFSFAHAAGMVRLAEEIIDDPGRNGFISSA